MAHHDHGERENGRECVNLPAPGEGEIARDHEARAAEAEDKGELEAAQDSQRFLAEIDLLGLLSCGAPRHIDLEEVREQGLREMERETAHEDGEHGNPLDVLSHWTEEGMSVMRLGPRCRGHMRDLRDPRSDFWPRR